MKKEIIINNQIIKDLSQNSVQDNKQEFVFGYDKILYEKDFYVKDGSLNIDKILIYKEYLKYEYLDLLDKVYGITKILKKSSKDFDEFLKVKNELKYICDLLEKNGKIDIFSFWFEFNKHGFDKNDKFWYENRKNIDEIEWKDIYNINREQLLEKIEKSIEKLNNLFLSNIENILNDLIQNVEDLDLGNKNKNYLIDYFSNNNYIFSREASILKYNDLGKVVYNNVKKKYLKIFNAKNSNEEKITTLVSLISFYQCNIDIKKDFGKYIDDIIISCREYGDIFEVINTFILNGFYDYNYFKKKLGSYFKFDYYYGLIYISFIKKEKGKNFEELFNLIEKGFLKGLKTKNKVAYLWFLLPEILSDNKISQKFWEKNNLIIVKLLINIINKNSFGEYDLRDFDEALYTIFDIPLYGEKIYFLIKEDYKKNILKYKFSFTKIINFESIKTIEYYFSKFIKNDGFVIYNIEIIENKSYSFLFDKYYKSILEKSRYYIDEFIENKNIKKEQKRKLLKDYYYLYVLKNSPYKQKITSFIKNSESGSFLLSGYRGVGKTSLLKKTFSEFDKNNDEKIIPVFVNIPEPDKNNKFSKKQLMNFIIRNLYKQVEKRKKDFPKNFFNKLENQYIRTFKDVKEVEGSLIVKKRGILKIILSILEFSFPLGISIIFYYFSNISTLNNYIPDFLKFDELKLIIAFLVFIIGYKISFTVLNIGFNSTISNTLYDENLAEEKLVENINSYDSYQKTYFFKIGNYFFNNPLSFIAEKLNNIVLFIILSPIIIGAIIMVLLLLLLVIIQIIVWNHIFMYIFGIIGLWFLWLFLSYVLKKFFSRPKHKFVIVIDELDKLLDFDKKKDGKEKGRMNMDSIFDILGKLKILFFDTKGLLFFVVTNKEAYDYHLMNKYQEDDLVSNIFNRILYLPMNEKEKFNLNFSVLGNKENSKNNFSNEELYNFNKWLYFKSHGNWRKMRFILNEKLENNGENSFLKLDTEKINFENKYYNFFEEIYNLFNEDLYNLSNESTLYNFLIGKENSDFGEKSINKEGILINFIESDFYKNYLLNLEKNGNEIFGEDKDGKNIFTQNNIKIILDDLCKIFIETEKLDNNNEVLFKNIGFFISSIIKISNEKAFRDYVLNNLLNFYEALRFYKKIDFKILFEKLKIDKKDLDYPVFEDFILYWLPFMLYYFGEKKLINKDELDKIFEKNIDNENSLSTEGFSPLNNNNILKLTSPKEENILIDIFLNQSINNLNSEGGFKLNFDEIKKNKTEYKKWKNFIEIKLNIVFGKITDYNKIDEDVFNFWKEKVVGKFWKEQAFESIKITKQDFYLYYLHNYKSKEKIDLSKYLTIISSQKVLKKDEQSQLYKYELMLFGNDFDDILEKNYIYYYTSNNHEELKNYIYSKINPLDDIKVIKEEWF